jgi:hypothetical protein
MNHFYNFFQVILYKQVNFFRMQMDELLDKLVRL